MYVIYKDKEFSSYDNILKQINVSIKDVYSKKIELFFYEANIEDIDFLIVRDASKKETSVYFVNRAKKSISLYKTYEKTTYKWKDIWLHSYELSLQKDGDLFYICKRNANLSNKYYYEFFYLNDLQFTQNWNITPNFVTSSNDVFSFSKTNIDLDLKPILYSKKIINWKEQTILERIDWLTYWRLPSDKNSTIITLNDNKRYKIAFASLSLNQDNHPVFYNKNWDLNCVCYTSKKNQVVYNIKNILKEIVTFNPKLTNEYRILMKITDYYILFNFSNDNLSNNEENKDLIFLFNAQIWKISTLPKDMLFLFQEKIENWKYVCYNNNYYCLVDNTIKLIEKYPTEKVSIDHIDLENRKFYKVSWKQFYINWKEYLINIFKPIKKDEDFVEVLIYEDGILRKDLSFVSKDTISEDTSVMIKNFSSFIYLLMMDKHKAFVYQINILSWKTKKIPLCDVSKKQDYIVFSIKSVNNLWVMEELSPDKLHVVIQYWKEDTSNPNTPHIPALNIKEHFIHYCIFDKDWNIIDENEYNFKEEFLDTYLSKTGGFDNNKSKLLPEQKNINIVYLNRLLTDNILYHIFHNDKPFSTFKQDIPYIFINTGHQNFSFNIQNPNYHFCQFNWHDLTMYKIVNNKILSEIVLNKIKKNVQVRSSIMSILRSMNYSKVQIGEQLKDDDIVSYPHAFLNQKWKMLLDFKKFDS